MTRRSRSARGVFIRRRAGKGFIYRDEEGERVDAPEVLARIDALAIPPAWRHVRIAGSEQARIQATGIDAAGRKQYLYHHAWRARQDARKFDRALALARRLPAIRRAVTEDLRGRHGAREQALAVALRLVDRAGFRVGSRRYVQQNGSFGVTTLQRRHVSVDGAVVTFRFPGKSGMRWAVDLHDADLAAYFAERADGSRTSRAIGFEEGNGVQPISAEALNGYLRGRAGMGVSAKDLRTWRGTVVAAETLAREREKGSDADQAWRAAIGAAAEWLHNTSAVARGSYVDPRLLLAYHEGTKLAGRAGKVSDAELAKTLASSPRTGPGT
ncbi:DNA topoisomerase IB [Sinomonas notoginsengisoli]|uniref:DNA topoisomerase IB n=1 Tax=Sinomonas notoginsengisoli TaxID=1457311 RepID=UPI001F4639C7|nr:DNA topoisomerase IB [Sinomonas notoginsengisoli]